jgi:hypothetical protein
VPTRTQDEIAERCKAKCEEPLNFESSTLLLYMDFAHARPFLIEDAAESNWSFHEPTREVLLAGMRDYMGFAWGKVLDHRGISAHRSVDRMRAWVWLLGDEFPEVSYPQYGAPILKALCDQYGFGVPDNEDIRRMAAGEPCGMYPHCSCGS